LEEERKNFEQKKKLFILSQPSPLRAQTGRQSRALSLAEEFLQIGESTQQADILDLHDVDSALTPAEQGTPGVAVGRIPAEQVPQAVALEMHEKIEAYQRERQQQQEELAQQLRFLQEKNQRLEQTLEEERQQTRNARNSVESCISTDRHSLSGPRTSGQSEKRRSAAHEAWSLQESVGRSRRGSGIQTTPSSGGDVQRRWLAEQRDFLLDELYPNGSPCSAFVRKPVIPKQSSNNHEAIPRIDIPKKEVCNLSLVFDDIETISLASSRAPAPNATAVSYNHENNSDYISAWKGGLPASTNS